MAVSTSEITEITGANTHTTGDNSSKQKKPTLLERARKVFPNFPKKKPTASKVERKTEVEVVSDAPTPRKRLPLSPTMTRADVANPFAHLFFTAVARVETKSTKVKVSSLEAEAEDRKVEKLNRQRITSDTLFHESFLSKNFFAHLKDTWEIFYGSFALTKPYDDVSVRTFQKAAKKKPVNKHIGLLDYVLLGLPLLVNPVAKTSFKIERLLVLSLFNREYGEDAEGYGVLNPKRFSWREKIKNFFRATVFLPFFLAFTAVWAVVKATKWLAATLLTMLLSPIVLVTFVGLKVEQLIHYARYNQSALSTQSVENAQIKTNFIGAKTTTEKYKATIAAERTVEKEVEKLVGNVASTFNQLKLHVEDMAIKTANDELNSVASKRNEEEKDDAEFTPSELTRIDGYIGSVDHTVVFNRKAKDGEPEIGLITTVKALAGEYGRVIKPDYAYTARTENDDPRVIQEVIQAYGRHKIHFVEVAEGTGKGGKVVITPVTADARLNGLLREIDQAAAQRNAEEAPYKLSMLHKLFGINKPPVKHVISSGKAELDEGIIVAPN